MPWSLFLGSCPGSPSPQVPWSSLPRCIRLAGPGVVGPGALASRWRCGWEEEPGPAAGIRGSPGGDRATTQSLKVQNQRVREKRAPSISGPQLSPGDSGEVGSLPGLLTSCPSPKVSWEGSREWKWEEGGKEGRKRGDGGEGGGQSPLSGPQLCDSLGPAPAWEGGCFHWVSVLSGVHLGAVPGNGRGRWLSRWRGRGCRPWSVPGPLLSPSPRAAQLRSCVEAEGTAAAGAREPARSRWWAEPGGCGPRMEARDKEEDSERAGTGCCRLGGLAGQWRQSHPGRVPSGRAGRSGQGEALASIP